MKIFGCFYSLSPLFSVLQGHKRASSDVSVASSEDEKIPLSPSILESVPEKVEPTVQVSTPTNVTVFENEVVTSFVEEPPAADDSVKEHEDVEEQPEHVEEKRPVEEPDAALAETDAAPEAPVQEMQRLVINVEDEKEVDNAELPTDSQENQEKASQDDMVEVNTPAEKEEDDEERYKHLKVTLILPEQYRDDSKENGEEVKGMNKTNGEDEKKVADKAKDDKENSSLELNLSISSFLSKSKEGGSISMQVRQ